MLRLLPGRKMFHMQIMIVDDEPLILRGEALLVQRVLPDADVRVFSSQQEAKHFVEISKVDVALLDIEMPGMSGVELARILKKTQPEINIIFVTAYDHYYADAMQMHASGYLVKPLREEALLEELRDLRHPVRTAEKKLFARAFGDFEVFFNDKPLLFRYQKTKEMFAYLIDRRGAMVTSEALITVLWGGETDRTNFFKQVRKDLNDTLTEIGYADILLRRRGSLGLLTDRISCDYYDWLQGLPSGINAYHGEYMRQYDWAESTWVNLEGKSNLWE